MKTVYLLRNDLRLFDNPALSAAAKSGEVIPLYVQPTGLGAASRWWLHHSLQSLMKEFAEYQCALILREGEAVQHVLDVVDKSGAERVVWNRVYTPEGMELGKTLKTVLEEKGIQSQSFNGQLLHEPTRVKTQQGTPFKVFSPFWKSCRALLNPPEPLLVPKITPSSLQVPSDALPDWRLLPKNPDWAGGLRERWNPGEVGAQQRLRIFLEHAIHHYKDGRDVPAKEATSMLSPHLAFGEISARQIWHEVNDARQAGVVTDANANKFISELGWREFSYYLLTHFPDIPEQAFNAKFQEFPWQNNDQLLTAWQQGKTGYPIVDAGMRELWHTGYMHNRVRMIVASFLTKHCLVHWREGADWFWDTLVDADLANNSASWQWVAGCGADAAPYFRIFNPLLQSEKFDANGEYLRRWVPELKALPNKWIHKPWEANDEVLAAANVELGVDYPAPVVDHASAREAALSAYQDIKTP